MSKESRNRKRIKLAMYGELDRLYAALPTVECKGLCVAECTTILVGPAEAYRMREASGLAIDYNRTARKVLTGDIPESVCPHLSTLGRCKIYADRPLVCRVFGVSEKMVCPHGCQPTRHLTPEEDTALYVVIDAIGKEALEVLEPGKIQEGIDDALRTIGRSRKPAGPIDSGYCR